MSRVAFVYHDDYLRHDTGLGHPERPDRLTAVTSHLQTLSLWKEMDHISPHQASVEKIADVHPISYVEMIERRCKAGENVLDFGDTHACSESYDIALLAAGGVLQGVDAVLQGKSKTSFSAVRPPGHHAETATVMGFCLFNNVAIGARHAQKNYGVQRVAILDWDVHHGNGTQEIFYEDGSVFYISLHQYPFYPGTGSADETGRGKGEGLTLNCPMKAGSGDREYRDAFARKILPALDLFKPELMMISAGFDAHRDDPLANIELTEDSFGWMTDAVRGIAEQYSGGKVVSVLEGGYNLEALAKSVEMHLKRLVE
jgi:acetoin utilization deacetylase AcuC-like enzyme